MGPSPLSGAQITPQTGNGKKIYVPISSSFNFRRLIVPWKSEKEPVTLVPIWRTIGKRRKRNCYGPQEGMWRNSCSAFCPPHNRSDELPVAASSHRVIFPNFLPFCPTESRSLRAWERGRDWTITKTHPEKQWKMRRNGRSGEDEKKSGKKTLLFLGTRRARLEFGSNLFFPSR